MRWIPALVLTSLLGAEEVSVPVASPKKIGREVSVPVRLKDDDEFRMPLPDLVLFGKKLFMANWTEQEGGGRPLTKGTGRAVSDPGSPLTGSRAFNRISGPDANSCYGCHNQPYGIAGGSGDFVTNVFVLGQRFDFVTFDPADTRQTRGSVDEQLHPVTLGNVGNMRATTAMFGAGYIEMLAREITDDLQTIRGTVKPGERRELVSKGISFGWISRRKDAMWDVGEVTGLPRASLLCPTPLNPPSLIVRPWHQAGNVVSIREFTNNALNQHHGIQTTERFGVGTDPDGDGFVDEMSRAEVTALSVFQAVMAPPGKLVPNDPDVERAIADGEKAFSRIGCAGCHVPSLPLTRRNWIYTEPNPYNPSTNLRSGDARELKVDLSDARLPSPRLKPSTVDPNVIDVPVFTDFRLHDITDPDDPLAAEPLDMNQTVWSAKFGGGNRRFLTKRLWGCANEGPYFHHGMFTTLRQSVLAHSGEALSSRRSFESLAEYEQDALIEFLKSLQVLPPGTETAVVDEEFRRKVWTTHR